MRDGFLSPERGAFWLHSEKQRFSRLMEVFASERGKNVQR